MIFLRVTAAVFFSVFIFLIAGCVENTKSSYVPSIAQLEKGESLLMDFRACHWGCTKARIIFVNNTAILKGHTLILTEEEISSLDEYFKLGEPLELRRECSLVIEIGFKKRKGFRKSSKRPLENYPCLFGLDNKLKPLLLVEHFLEEPDTVPYWRLSLEEQSKRRTLPTE